MEAFYRGDLETLSPPVDFIIYGPSERALGQPKILATLPVVFIQNPFTKFAIPLPIPKLNPLQPPLGLIPAPITNITAMLT